MTELERLTVLIEECAAIHESGFDPDKRISAEALARYLLSNGVTLPPCKVGDTVWVFNQLKGCIYENKVHGIYLTGTGDCKNTVRLEYTNQFGEKSYRKYSFSQFGKNVFLSPEEAERRKFEYLKRLQ